MFKGVGVSSGLCALQNISKMMHISKKITKNECLSLLNLLEGFESISEVL